MAIEPLDSLTRICLARQLSSSTWLRLFGEAKKQGDGRTHHDDQSQDSLHADAIDVLLPLTWHGQSMLAQTYLQACLAHTTSRRHLLHKLLFLVDQHFFQSTDSADDLQANSFFESTAATFLACDPAALSQVDTLMMSRATMVQLRATSKLLSMAARHQLSSAFLLALQLLQVPLATTKSAGIDIETSFVEEIASTRAALQAMTDATQPLPQPFESAFSILDSLERRLDPVSHRRRTISRPPTFPSMPIEMHIILQNMLNTRCHRASEILVGSLSARLALQRVTNNPGEDANIQAVVNAWMLDLYTTSCSRLQQLTTISNARTQVLWKALLLGVLPGRLKAVQANVRLAALGIDWTSAMQYAREKCAEPSGQTPSDRLLETIHKFHKHMQGSTTALPHADVLNSPEDLVSALFRAQHDYTMHVSAARTFQSRWLSWVASPDITSLHQLLQSLTRESPSVFDYLLLHVDAGTLLAGPCKLLDSWDGSDEFGAGQAMELFGGILLALKTLVVRHGLHTELSGVASAMAGVVIAPQATLAEARSLSNLSAEHKKLVSDWITALYGSEGIDDDLIRATPARVMLFLAPTIVEQSLLACEAGVLDHDGLASGLSYFSQDFLTFTLPSIVSFLCRRQQVDWTIIKSLLASDSTPSCVWELMEDDLRAALQAAPPSDGGLQDYLTKRLGAQSVTSALSEAALTVSILQGTDAPQTLCAVIQGRGASYACDTIMQATQDSFLASLLLTMDDQVVRMFSRLYLPKMLRSATLPHQRDHLADVLALCEARGAVIPYIRRRNSQEVDFWKRADDW